MGAHALAMAPTHGLRVLVLEVSGTGGWAQYTFSLLCALSEAGVEPVLATNAEWELDRVPRAFEVRRVTHQGQGYAAAVSAILGAARATEPAVVHVQSLVSTRKDAALFFLLRRSGLPVVFTAHNVVPHEGTAWDRLGHRLMYGLADRVIVHSEASRARLLALHRGARTRIRVIPQGHYARLFGGFAADRRRARADMGLSMAEPVLLFFGAIRPYKGLDVLLRALPAVRRCHPAVRLLICGRPLHAEAAALPQLVADLGLREYVTLEPRYLGFEEVAARFAAADVAVFPYREVDTSAALHVALTLGCPVIATRVGGTSEEVAEGITGRLVEPGDPFALARAIVEALDDPPRTRAMGARAREVELVTRDWAPIARATAACYRELA